MFNYNNKLSFFAAFVAAAVMVACGELTDSTPCWNNNDATGSLCDKLYGVDRLSRTLLRLLENYSLPGMAANAGTSNHHSNHDIKPKLLNYTIALRAIRDGVENFSTTDNFNFQAAMTSSTMRREFRKTRMFLLPLINELDDIIIILNCSRSDQDITMTVPRLDVHRLDVAFSRTTFVVGNLKQLLNSWLTNNPILTCNFR